ncbi:deaminase [Streptomyces sp. CB00316]|uniref:dihydrofolate reductase family protein n=1 Tax=unclassified Streptomyces TaxID=2593676 RepID=UPI00093C6C0B|nr:MULTISPECIES: dihydrofolate reductase family protein [unclassified Streptomyces]MBT2379464.1 dihydrofolate reductase [Streptomyces sp. ISL-111]MBT2428480.1 dihydrofolate reductase [Streptomyces sp. ISL-112]MBT2465233.1 dihydrofolate reductase [Streptomyces sp. ISL-63]OKJ19285.1 deaminase [Streptomyces sp. CB00316]
MNKIVSSISVSLDGFFEGPDRDIDWHSVDEEVHQHFNDYLRTAGAFVEGRVTYQLMEDFWPTADQDPAGAGPMAEFAGIWRDMPKYVYSRTLESVGPGATLLREVDRDEVCAVRDAAAGDLIVGGADLVETFRRLDLVDEYRVYIHPVLLGRGRPFFGDAADRQGLRLLESRAFGNGVVLLRYETDPAPADA